jgi:hemerythrin-like domain-containing protein
MESQITVWKAEHANFLRLLDLLDAEIRVFHEGGRPNYDLMLDIVYYLIHYPDRFHHPKENAAMEKLVQKAPDCGSLASDFTHEHKVIAESGAALHEQLQGVVAGAMMPRAAVEGSAAIYAAYYRRHMAREEKELFPRTERSLEAKDWAAIEKAVPTEKDPLFGDHPEARYAVLERQIARAAGWEHAQP